MNLKKVANIACGTGVALVGLTVASPLTASATTTKVFVPCAGPNGGAAGLVAAMAAANSAGGGTLNLAPGCTYTLTVVNNTSSNPNPMIGGILASNGLPVVTAPITINGPNATIARSSSAPQFRLFEVDGPSGNLTLQGVTLTGGLSPAGGALLNNEGTATLNGTRITANTAVMGGGGIASGIVASPLGPIGVLTLNGARVDHNTALGGGGGGILNHGGTLTLKLSRVDDNSTGGGGGGIASGPANGGVAGNSDLVLDSSRVDDNISTGGPADGAGGIANGGTMTLNFTLVDHNSAPGSSGGGILNHGTATLNASQVDDNTAPTDSSGDLGLGGGIANLNFDVELEAEGATNPPPSGVLTLNATVVTRNTASGFGGGIADVGIDANFMPTLPAGSLALNLSAVTANSAGSGGGIFSSPGSPVSLKLTVVARNTPDNCIPSGAIAGCVG